MDPTILNIYTDGPGIKGKIVTAIYNQTANEATNRHLGRDRQCNVFIAEVTAQRLATEILRDNLEMKNLAYAQPAKPPYGPLTTL
jgi:hypothetical protein